MEAFQLGPLSVALDRLLAVGALWFFLLLVSASRRWTDTDPVRPSVCAMVAGIIAARVGFVMQDWPAFASEPLATIFLWQGGFSPVFGLATAAIVVMSLLRGKARALGLAALLAVSAAWFVADRVSQVQPKVLPRSLVVVRMDGTAVALDSLRGQPFVINLWATWCGPCQRELPMLVQVAKANPDVPVLIINQGEDAERVFAFLAREGLPSSNIVWDAQGSVGRTLGSSALPTTAFVSADGKVTELHIGEISRAALIASINDLRQTGASFKVGQHSQATQLESPVLHNAENRQRRLSGNEACFFREAGRNTAGRSAVPTVRSGPRNPRKSTAR